MEEREIYCETCKHNDKYWYDYPCKCCMEEHEEPFQRTRWEKKPNTFRERWIK